MEPLEMTLALSDGSMYEFPMFDPVVASFVKNPTNLIDTLIHQINVEKIYARFFEGKKNLTFLDIGANIGLVSVYAAPACDRIVAVEPSPETFQVLKSVTMHRTLLAFSNIECVQAALAPKEGKVEFFVNDVNSTASSTVNTYGKRIEVQGLKLSDILRIYQLEHVDFLKCDSEGGEGDSLNYDELSLAVPIVESYMVETHNCPSSTWEHKLEDLLNHFWKLGYRNLSVNGMAITASK